MSARVQLAALALLGLLAGCGSPLVGAQCKPGFVLCDGLCVDLARDAEHCGSCGHSCGGAACKASKCSGEPAGDAGPADGGKDGSAMPMGSDAGADGGSLYPPSVGKGGSGTPFLPDGGVHFPDPKVSSGCGVGLTSCSGDCVDIASDPAHCGECGVGCPTGQFCALGTCTDVCNPPLSFCSGRCFDLQNDENHCGDCGTVCVSGLCNAGQCADAVPGSLVVVGHDYGAAASDSMRRIASNALFLQHKLPVRTLVYRGSADPASVRGLKAAFDLAGLPWKQTDADPDQVSAQLRQSDAFVIEPQPGASDADLTALGQKWGLALSQFLIRGGVVVLFETASANNQGTYQVLEPAGLFTASAREKIDPQQVTVVSPADGEGIGITTNYRAEPVSVHFLDVLSQGTVVVKDGDGEAVVYHRIIVP